MVSSLIKTEGRAEQCLNEDLGINCPHPDKGVVVVVSRAVCARACEERSHRRVGSTDRYQCEPLTADIPTAILTWVLLRSLPGWVDSLKPQACSLANWLLRLYPLYQLLALLCIHAPLTSNNCIWRFGFSRAFKSLPPGMCCQWSWNQWKWIKNGEMSPLHWNKF